MWENNIVPVYFKGTRHCSCTLNHIPSWKFQKVYYLRNNTVKKKRRLWKIEDLPVSKSFPIFCRQSSLKCGQIASHYHLEVLIHLFCPSELQILIFQQIPSGTKIEQILCDTTWFQICKGRAQILVIFACRNLIFWVNKRWLVAQDCWNW